MTERLSRPTDAGVDAVRMLEQPAIREVVPRDPRISARWHSHDYPSTYAKWNYHPEYEIHLVRESTGHYIVGNGIGIFSPGQVVLVGPNLPHNWISDVLPGEVVVGRDVAFQFLGSWLDSCREQLPELNELGPLLARSTRGIEFFGATAARAAEELEAIGVTAGVKRLTHILRVLDVLNSAPQTDFRALSAEGIRPPDDPHTADVMNRALDYIFQNMHGSVSLSRAASMVGMSESAFSRYFKQASSQTFTDIVRKMRIAHACKQLRLTTKLISIIAKECGYSNISNFNRQFMREQGITPSGYRDSNRVYTSSQ
ncbi:AraC family transcriptional regulator [Arthrobacter sp. AETb3-4]|jgi:AraC-like DNA-binding protein|uniref:AraC family transcriptional regulator n=2 Tax=Arthrobacter wenxiniae TaxID=2713570 RepID=A0A7Y7IHB1_9MICC|nr:AraC family transcriptional regulator [Arthrobacter wenxiniae]